MTDGLSDARRKRRAERGPIRKCWEIGPRDHRDGMMTVCVLRLGHDGAHAFVRDHVSTYSKPWQPVQEHGEPEHEKAAGKAATESA